MKKILLIFCSFVITSAAMAQFSIQKAVIDEYTGAWCGYCPDGAVILEGILQNNNNAIGVSIHQGDGMTTTDGDALISFYGPAFPQATINRSSAPISRGAWGSAVNTATQGASSVSVSIDSMTYDEVSRELNCVVKATFTGPENGDLRFHLLLTEDYVTGTGSGYNQVNYDNGTPGHPYQGAGNPITGYVHRHVLRHQLDGPWGTSGIIPTSVNFGTAVSNSYTYTVPANWKAEDIHLVAYVSRFDGNGMADRRILNGEEADMYEPTVGLEDFDSASDIMQIAPNPMNDRTKVLFTLRESGNIRMEVINQMGQHIATLGEGFMNDGAHTMYWNGRNDQGTDVANGLYFVRLVTEHGQSGSSQVLLQR